MRPRAWRVAYYAWTTAATPRTPYGRGVGETLEAHLINRRGGYPCGCGHLNACTVDGVDARAVLLFVARDVGLGLDDGGWRRRVWELAAGAGT